MEEKEIRKRVTFTKEQWNLILEALDKFLIDCKNMKEEYNIEIVQPIYNYINEKVKKSNKNTININLSERECIFCHLTLSDMVIYFNGDFDNSINIAKVLEDVMSKVRWRNACIRYSWNWHKLRQNEINKSK